MESCKTPSHTDLIQFQFDHVSTPVIPAEYVKKMQNLIVNSGGEKRCFTPIVSDLCSPGLSPITQENSGGTTETAKDHFTFPAPLASSKQYKKISPTTMKLQQNLTPKQQQQQQQQEQLKQQQQQLIEAQLCNENLSFELDLSTSTKLEFSLDSSSRSETSKNSCILNHTLDVTLILKELGLGQHSEKFSKKGIDLEKFLKLKLNELKGLGVQSDEDCKAIIDMVGELNATQALKI